MSLIYKKYRNGVNWNDEVYMNKNLYLRWMKSLNIWLLGLIFTIP